MLDRRCSRNHQDIRRPLEQPRKRNLHGRGTKARGDVRQGRRLEWSEPAEWKEWHVGDAVASKIGYEYIIRPMCEVVLVLYADDRSDLSGFIDLLGRDIAKPDMTHQTFLLKFRQNRERCLDRSLSGFMNAKHTAQVDHIDHIQPQIAEVVVNRCGQLLA